MLWAKYWLIFGKEAAQILLWFCSCPRFLASV